VPRFEGMRIGGQHLRQSIVGDLGKDLGRETWDLQSGLEFQGVRKPGSVIVA